MLESIFQNIDKVSMAIKRLKHWEPKEGYFLAFSGGKDSIVIERLAKMAGIKYTSHYTVTSIDPPELIWFIKKYYPETVFDYPKYKDGTIVTMWNLIIKKHIPPTRWMRYCCQYLKEGSGKGETVITGVRWAESSKRKINRSGLEVLEGSKKRLLEDPDNLSNERTARMCGSKGKYIVNPIIDWSDEDVWAFIKDEKIPYCNLYDNGFKRLGCIGCPMSVNQKKELELYPKFKNLYLNAFKKMLENMPNKNHAWKNEFDVYEWWVNPPLDKDNFCDLWGIKNDF